MCGVLISEQDEENLRNLGVKDSKLLTKEKREEIFEYLTKTHKHQTVIVDVGEVDDAVNGNNGLNLNWLEATKTADIINELKPDKAIIDLPSNNKETYHQFLLNLMKNKKMEIVLEHKADINYISVAAASIIAKVTRDREIEKIKKKIGVDFGSGYMSDPKTSEFLEKYHEKHRDIFRKSWMPYQKITDKKFQSKLGDFSKFVDEGKPEHKEMIEKLKILEDFGYKFIDTSTEHEHVRMKGDCTITLYKNGKLLVQGKEEHKKAVEKILNKKNKE